MSQIAHARRESRIRRHGRVRKKVHGTAERPRLAVFRSNKQIYAQLIDDRAGRTLAAAAVGAGSIAICHVNDPFFWIAAAMARLSPGRALYVISLGSVVMAVGALIVLAALRQFL